LIALAYTRLAVIPEAAQPLSGIISPGAQLVGLREGWVPALPSVGRDDSRGSMPLHPAYAQVSALLAAVFILIAGNGLANTLIPLSATAASFPPLSIGLIGSAYSAAC